MANQHPIVEERLHRIARALALIASFAEHAACDRDTISMSEGQRQAMQGLAELAEDTADSVRAVFKALENTDVLDNQAPPAHGD